MFRSLFKWRNVWNNVSLNECTNLSFATKNISIVRSSTILLVRVINRHVATSFVARESEGDTQSFKCSNNNKKFGTNLDDKERRLKVLQLEVEVSRQEGRRVPSLDFLSENHWEYILTLSSRSARMKYYAYLWQIQIKKENRKRQQEEKAAVGEKIKNKVLQERAENKHIVYGLGHVSMFLRIYDATIVNWMNSRLIRAIQYSPKIVLDCSYDEYMTKREAEYTAKQLMLTFAENRADDDPFDIHFCNVNLNSICMKSLQNFIPTMLNPEFPMNIHEKCFTELFPKENLIYLTPHCRTDLLEYNPNNVYIIGAIVDTGDSKPLSLAKAKRLGIRMARLPLDQYLQWGAGSGKSLTLNQMMKILLDLRKTGDWSTALKHVPRRKLDLNNSENSQNSRKRAAQFNVDFQGISSKSSRTCNLHHSYKETSKSTWDNKRKQNLT